MADGMSPLKDHGEISSLGRGCGSGLKRWHSGAVAEDAGQAEILGFYLEESLLNYCKMK